MTYQVNAFESQLDTEESLVIRVLRDVDPRSRSGFVPNLWSLSTYIWIRCLIPDTIETSVSAMAHDSRAE